ncbi:MAG: DUF3501 family protein [Caldivirga sp.]|jgi:hypothetical protein
MASKLSEYVLKIYPPSQYSSIRSEVYRLISDYKRNRYVNVNDRVTVLFEDAATVWFQIEETVFLEGTDDVEVIREAIRTYNPMVPKADELTMTVFIHINNYDELRNLLPRYRGIEGAVDLIIDGKPITAKPIYPEDYAPGALPRSIHYLKASATGLGRMLSEGRDVEVRVRHPMVNRGVKLTAEQLDAIRHSIIGVSWVI